MQRFPRPLLEEVVFLANEAWIDDEMAIAAKYHLAGLSCSLCEVEAEIVFESSHDLGSAAWCHEVSNWLRERGWYVCPPTDEGWSVDVFCPKCRNKCVA
jgi:hypothetical protein